MAHVSYRQGLRDCSGRSAESSDTRQGAGQFASSAGQGSQVRR